MFFFLFKQCGKGRYLQKLEKKTTEKSEMLNTVLKTRNQKSERQTENLRAVQLERLSL